MADQAKEMESGKAKKVPKLPPNSRWFILRDAILKAARETAKAQAEAEAEASADMEDADKGLASELEAVSVRRFKTYGLMQSKALKHDTISLFTFTRNGALNAPALIDSRLKGTWHHHALSNVDSIDDLSGASPHPVLDLTPFPSDDDDHLVVRVFHLQPEVSLKAMIGFNNTGNVCIWPSEELLSYFVAENPNLFSGHDVCELGGGMASLAGLCVAALSEATEVVVTDGNEASVSCLAATVEANQALYGATVVTARLLDWASTNHREQLVNRFDSILCADCLFFDEGRDVLLQTMDSLLKPQGVAYVIAPSRSRTWHQFHDLALDHPSFTVQVMDEFSKRVTGLTDFYSTSLPSFDPNLHAPMMMTLTKS
eukprot:m.118281 g.118281  ORF g.118281 m.118281 type:complete len:371 (-) comp13650_c1_seq5:2248-3360(-)